MASPKELPQLSAAQLEIMDLVWDRSKITVAEIWQELLKRRKISRNTVSTVLARLEEKGWLDHHTVGNRYQYFARIPREKTVNTLVQRMVDSVFKGSAERLVMALLEGRGISEEEARRIRSLIRNAEKKDS